MDIAAVGNEIRRLQTRHDQAVLSAEKERKVLDEVVQNVDALEEARTVVQCVAEELQKRAHDRIARVVTRCLAAVFDEPYEFRIVFERKRGKTEAKLQFERDGQTYDDPLNEVGGGVLDVAALALRLSCLLVSRPPARKTLILDEPWSNVRGEDNRRRTRRLLEVLADEFSVQWIVNTDIETYRSGTVVEVCDGEMQGVRGSDRS